MEHFVIDFMFHLHKCASISGNFCGVSLAKVVADFFLCVLECLKYEGPCKSIKIHQFYMHMGHMRFKGGNLAEKVSDPSIFHERIPVGIPRFFFLNQLSKVQSAAPTSLSQAFLRDLAHGSHFDFMGTNLLESLTPNGAHRFRWKAMLAKMEECDVRVAAGEDTHHPLMILGKDTPFGGVGVGTPRYQIILMLFPGSLPLENPLQISRWFSRW